jgi:glycosyltransferase involved in cell wall biosynthesis
MTRAPAGQTAGLAARADGEGRPPRRLRPVCMFAHSYYEEDSRVRREAETLVAAGRPVDVYALRRPGDDRSGELDGVHIRRLDVERHQGAGLLTYVGEYVSFAARAGWAAARAHGRRRYALVQVHSLPDFLAFGALPLRLAGVPLLLDLHEAMPEFFRMRFPRASNAAAYALLRLQERLSIGLATQVVTVNDALRDRLVGLGVPPDKITVVPNHPSLARFDPSSVPERPFMAGAILRLVYAGALTPVYELDVAIDAVAKIVESRPGLDVRFDIFGRGDSEAGLRARVTAAGLDERVTFRGRIPFEAVPAAIAAADIGLAPTRLDEYTKLSLSTKLFEYGAMRRPIVATHLPLIERTFGEGTVLTYAPGDVDSLARAILHLVDEPAERESRVTRTTALIADLAWERQLGRYLGIVEALAPDGLSSGADDHPSATTASSVDPEDV